MQKITNLDSLITHFEEGQIIAVSDASLSDDGFASHSYTLVSTNEKQRIRGSALVDCEEDDVESTRVEKAGVLGMHTIITIFESLSSTTTKPIAVYCDNSEAVKKRTRSRHLQSFVKFVGSNYNMDAEIERMLSNIRTTVDLIHLKGHQDDAGDFDYDSAPLSVRLNIDMDDAAKSFLKEDQNKLNPTRIAPFFPASKETLSIHDNVVSKNIDAHIKLHKNGPSIEARLMTKGIVQASHLPLIQWRGLEQAMQKLKTIGKIPVTKIIHEKWSTEKEIAKWYQECSRTCLRCKLTQETHDHVYQCRSDQAKSTMENSLSTLRSRLKKYNTVPMITGDQHLQHITAIKFNL